MSVNASAIQAAAALIITAGTVTAQEYTVEILALEGDVIGGRTVGYIGGIDLADNGFVAFAGGSDQGSTVWSPTEVLTTQGEFLGGVTLPNFNWPTIQVNNSGHVAVSGFLPDSGIYSTTDGRLGGEGAVIDGLTLTSTVGTCIHLANDDTVTFYAGIDDGRAGVFTQDTLLMAEGDVIDSIPIEIGHGIFVTDSMDVDANGVPYLIHSDENDVRGIVTPNGFVVRDGDPFGSNTLNNINSTDFAVSESGNVAIVDNGVAGNVFVTGIPSPVYDQNAVVDGVSTGYIFDLDVNDAGTVAFRSNAGGVFTQHVKVFDVGDQIDGLALVEADYGAITINDLGMIAFTATVEDATGTEYRAAILATPAHDCYADCDTNGALNIDDIDCFVADFLGGSIAADCDANATLNVDDVDCFVAGFLSGCP